MTTLKAVVGISSTSNIKAKINSNEVIQAGTINIGSAGSLSELTDIDMSALEQGAVLIYDETAGLWKAKADMDDGTRIESGHY